MSSEFQKSTLGKLVTFSNGKSSPERYDNGQFPVFGSNGLIGRANETNSPSASIVVGRVGSYCGSVHFSRRPCWITDNAIRATAKDNNDPSFLFYLLKQLNLNNWRSGSGQPLINQTTLNSIEVYVPPPLSQKAIGEFIGALDDRIAILRETNTTLEAIAQVMFKSWFIDFDPVHAKQQGLAPEGMNEGTAALFPDSFEESELGVVPRGWKVEPLTEVFDFKEGPGIRNWQYTNSDQGTRFINIRCIQDGDLSIETANRITEEEANGKYAHFHLQAWDVVVSTSGTLGRSAIVRQEHLPLMLNTSVIRFQPIKEKMRFSFVYEYLNSPEFLFKLESMASGSVQKNFGPMHIKQMKLVCPPIDLLSYYESVCRPLFEKVVENRARIVTLSTLRDTLLPRLISGQLRIPEVEVAL
jgi:type I restriction enzyme S subunit